MLDFARGHGILSVGVGDASFDYAVGDNVSVGATTMLNPIANDLALRATWRFNGWLGCTLAAGTNFQSAWGVRVPSGVSVPAWQAFWLQPAVVVTLPLPIGGAKLTGTFGPYLGYNLRNETSFANIPQPFDLWLVPNVEVAVPFGSWNELTLGGNSPLGWRMRF